MEMTSISASQRPAWWKYWTVLATRTQEDMAYRVNYIVGALFRFLPLVTTLFLWIAIYRSREAGGDSEIAGWNLGDMVSYYAFMYIARGFSSMPGMTRDICNDIKDGALNRYLIRPFSYFWYQVMYRLAHKLVFWFVALLTFPPVFWFLRDYFVHEPTLFESACFLASLVIAFVIGICFSFLVGLLAFWFLEISTFLFVIMVIEFFLSGHLIPLNLLPASVQPFLTFLPFSYEGYWPCAILMGKVPASEMGRVLGVGAFWAVFFFLACQVVWKVGVKRYAAVGG
jgi:ABC-2 type transport system permease protein